MDTAGDTQNTRRGIKMTSAAATLFSVCAVAALVFATASGPSHANLTVDTSAPTDAEEISALDENPNQSDALITDQKAQPIVVEMFLSQACPQCPPAAEYMTDLAMRDDVVALAWHVDYWDNYVHPRKGHWKDPFANAAFTERQSAYNMQVRGRARNFTPQAIINGSQSVVASKHAKIEKAIETIVENKANDGAAQPNPHIRFAQASMPDIGNALQINVENLGPDDEALFVTFYRDAKTFIKSGYNQDTSFVNANVVSNITLIEHNSDSADAQLIAATPQDGMGCAVLVQAAHGAEIVAASYCP